MNYQRRLVLYEALSLGTKNNLSKQGIWPVDQPILLTGLFFSRVSAQFNAKVVIFCPLPNKVFK